MNEAYFWTRLILSLGLIVQTLETFSLINFFTESGVWRWSEIKVEFHSLRYFDLFLNDNSFFIMLILRLICALFLIVSFNFPSLLLLLIFNLMIVLRFRGSFNGGSDYMTSIILLAFTVASFFKTEKVMAGALWYIALQSILSYFFAGLVKLKQSNWRSGKALKVFINSPNYNPPIMIIRILDNQIAAFIISWIVMGAELLFPMAISSNHSALIFISAAFLFHLNNVWLFGLNRFLLAWMATYPALFFVANSLSNSLHFLRH